MPESSPVYPLEAKRPNRREFLYYGLGASLVLLTAGTFRTLSAYLQPDITPRPIDTLDHYDSHTELILLNDNVIPSTNEFPVELRFARCVLVKTDAGLIGFSLFCPFERCLLRWQMEGDDGRFRCPCSGSQFRLDGTWIQGPARRDLDRYGLIVKTTDGTFETPPDGSPISIDGAESIVLDTTRVILGKPHPRQ